MRYLPPARLVPPGPPGPQTGRVEVLARKALLRRFGAVARPAFKANHTLMMRHGERGLATYLAGVRAGRRPRS